VRLAVSQRDGMAAADVAATQLDAYVLALPNGTSEPYVQAIEKARPDAVIVDLSADHRFANEREKGWVYGQPERNRAALRGARRIANPGCYATAAQLALAPLVALLGGPANVFGVSGYSGAGTTPSPRNDPEALRDNLMPYALTGHVHEREVATQLGCSVFFMPHVAPFFRGLTVTVSVALERAATLEQLTAGFARAYGSEPLVRFQEAIPLVRDIAEKHDTVIGGLSVSEDGRHAVVIATLDNLLAGAATQALRNVNLALGFPENQGVPGVAS
jgi:N-acetyl-gamma-glutamyl-phosphate reductase common form